MYKKSVLFQNKNVPKELFKLKSIIQICYMTASRPQKFIIAVYLKTKINSQFKTINQVI